MKSKKYIFFLFLASLLLMLSITAYAQVDARSERNIQENISQQDRLVGSETTRTADNETQMTATITETNQTVVTRTNATRERVAERDTSDYDRLPVAADSSDNKTTRTGRNPQTGKEIKIAAGRGEIPSFTEARAKILINDNVYYADSRISSLELLDGASGSQYRCGVSDKDVVVCQVTPSDGTTSRGNIDSELYCWGKGELRECSNEEIVPVAECRGLGRMKCSDVTLERASGSEEIEILSWSWGSARSSSQTDADDDRIELSYVWTISGESGNSSDRPTESISLNFGKIKIEYSTDNNNNNNSIGTIEVELPAMRVAKDSLIFTTVLLGNRAVKDNNQYCGTTNHLLNGGDCNDEDVSRPPERVADRSNISDRYPDSDADGFPDDLDIDFDGDGIPSQAAIDRRDRASPALARNITSGISPRNLSEEERNRVREYLSTLDNIRGEDFGLAVAYVASRNERVREIRYDNSTRRVNVKYDDDVRFLGFIPMRARTVSTLDEDGNIETRRPWWSFLARKTSDTSWLNPESIPDYLDPDDDGDGIPTAE
ncbi:MAG: hypothetical protein ACMXYG_07215 [Candidatus Woesearchaeota archaeon]